MCMFIVIEPIDEYRATAETRNIWLSSLGCLRSMQRFLAVHAVRAAKTYNDAGQSRHTKSVRESEPLILM